MLRSARGKKAKPRLRPTDLTLAPGSRVAVLGRLGAGKTSLLRVLGGAEPPSRGSVSWDGQATALAGRVAYLPPEVALARLRVSDLLGLTGPEPAPAAEQLELLGRTGVWKVVARFPKGLRQKVSSAALSPTEARSLLLGRILLGDETLWVLDDPVDGLGPRARRRVLEAILEAGRDRTLVVALARPALVECFDRVLVMRKGAVAFDGTPAEWEERRHARSDPGGGAG